MPRALLVAIAVLVVAAPSASARTARSADGFVGSVGVNTHLLSGDTSYGNFAKVRMRLRELGVRHIRDGICGTCHWQRDRLRALGADGIRLLAQVGSPATSIETRSGNLAAVRRLGKIVEAVEGANEWDHFSGRSPAWVAQERAHQQWLWNAVQAKRALRDIPVVGPSLVYSWTRPTSWDELGDISGWLDRGNLHPYPGGRPPESHMTSELALARQIARDKPLVAGESGYHNALGQSNWDHPAVPEDVAAVYLTRVLLENFRRRILRTYVYELLDELPGRAHSDMEDSFGLLRADHSRKPAYVAVRNLLAVLADPGPALRDARVPLRLRSDAPDLREVLLRKRDGELDLALWRAASVWDTDIRTRRAAAAATVRVRSHFPVRTVRRVDPRQSGGGSRVPIDNRRVKVKVGAAPIVLRITPPARCVSRRRAIAGSCIRTGHAASSTGGTRPQRDHQPRGDRQLDAHEQPRHADEPDRRHEQRHERDVR